MPEQNPVQLKLEGFDDPKLDKALQKSGRIRTEFSSDLLPLVRKPRYLALVIKHYDRLKETGDFTIDRLLYEDWKDRLERKRSLKMTDRQYRTFLGQLAQRYREGRTRFSERDLDHLLPRSAADDLSELLTGGLLSVDHGLAQEYKVEPGWLIHSHGLLLASQLIERGNEAELEETLAQFLEPHLEVDQQGDILAAACLFSLFTPDYPQKARLALLHAWVRRQNHSQTSVDRLQAYVPIAAMDYLALLEGGTLKRRLDHRAIERLEYALLTWRSLLTVELVLVERASSWLSLTYPEGFPFMRPPKRVDAHGAPAERKALDYLRRQIQNRAGAGLVPGQSLLLAKDYTLEATDSDRLTWLADSALFFLSALPVQRRLLPLRQWALSRAVIGHAREWGQIAWLLRRPATWEFEDEFFDVVDPLLNHPFPAVRKAGGELLSCLGTPRAIERRTGLTKEMRHIAPILSNTDNNDPCSKGLYQWRREHSAKCSERQDLRDEVVAWNLSAHALDPSFEIPPPTIPRIRATLDAIETSQIWAMSERTSAKKDLEDIELVVARAYL